MNESSVTASICVLSVRLMVCVLTGPICWLHICSYDSFYARLFEAVSGQCQFQTVLLASQVLQARAAIPIATQEFELCSGWHFTCAALSVTADAYGDID